MIDTMRSKHKPGLSVLIGAECNEGTIVLGPWIARCQVNTFILIHSFDLLPIFVHNKKMMKMIIKYFISTSQQLDIKR